MAALCWQVLEQENALAEQQSSLEEARLVGFTPAGAHVLLA